MKTLTIRGMPDEVHAALRERARQNRRSMNQEVLLELTAALEKEGEGAAGAKARMERNLEAIGRLRSDMNGFLKPEEIDRAIEEGRR
ncbi:MAG: FitA-like ribbon-helix-helix domain-containing protein [Opitutales bacterium]